MMILEVSNYLILFYLDKRDLLRFLIRKLSFFHSNRESNEYDNNFISPDLKVKAKSKNEDNFIIQLIGRKKPILNTSQLNVSLLSIFPNTVSKTSNKDNIETTSTNYISDISNLSLDISRDEYLIEILSNTDNFVVIENKKTLCLPKKLSQLIEYSLFIFSKKEKDRENLLFICEKDSSKDNIKKCYEYYADIFEYLRKKYDIINRKIIFVEISKAEKPIEDKFDKILSEIKNIQTEMNYMKTEMNYMKTEVNNIKTEVNNIKTDVSTRLKVLEDKQIN